MNNDHHRYASPFLTAALVVLGLGGGVASVVSALHVQATPQAGQADTVKVEPSVVVVTTRPAELVTAAEDNDLDVVQASPVSKTLSYVTIEGTTSDSDIKELAEEKDNIIVGDIAPNKRYKLAVTPNDTHYGDQWNLPKINAPNAWDVSYSGAATTVAVLDTGVLSNQQWGSQGPFTHPDFPDSKMWQNVAEVGTTTQEGPSPNCTSRSLTLDKSCNNRDDDNNGFVDDYRGWDFMGGYRGTSGACPNYNDGTTYQSQGGYLYQDNDPQPYSCDDSTDTDQLNKTHNSGGCDYGEGACAISHGTSVASIAGASSNDGAGVAGVDWNAKIMNLRVMDGYGYGNSAEIAAAITYATTMGADVVNMSLALDGPSGCTGTDSVIESAMTAADAADVVVVAASGNNGSNGVCYPARSSRAIAVGSSDINDVKSGFSTYGAELDVLAPGSNVPVANAPSDYQPGTYDSGVYGTSFSSPHVAGLAASIRSLNPSMTASAIRTKISYTADKLSVMGGQPFTTQHGYGRINAAAALDSGVFPVPSYSNFSKRAMWVTSNTVKTDFLSGNTYGATYKRGAVVYFNSKAYVNGEWYYRTTHNTAYGDHRGIKASLLKDAPVYTKFKAKKLRVTKTTQKTNILYGTRSGMVMKKNHAMWFNSKTKYNGVWYYRTTHSTKYGYHRGVPSTQLK